MSTGTAAYAQRHRLAAVLALAGLVLVAELVGGSLSGSLALFSDAGHVGADVAGLVMALLAVRFAARPPTSARTFGYQRAEILVAVLNSVLLFGVSAAVLAEAVYRLIWPPAVSAGLMLGFAGGALVARLVSLLLLGGHAGSLTTRAAFLEALADTAGAAAVLVAAMVIAGTGWRRADPVASLIVGALIVPRTWRLLRDAVDVLLEGTPRGVDLAEVRRHLCGSPGVLDVHDLHAWTITSGVPVLSAHVVIDAAALADGGGGRVLDRLQQCLGGHFAVEHCTFQLEPAGHLEHEQRTHP